MYKYEMDSTSIVVDTERTWFCPQTDRRQTDKVKPVYPPFNFVEAGVQQVEVIGHNMKSQQTLHSSPSQVSYVVSFMSILDIKKWPYVIEGNHPLYPLPAVLAFCQVDGERQRGLVVRDMAGATAGHQV